MENNKIDINNYKAKLIVFRNWLVKNKFILISVTCILIIFWACFFIFYGTIDLFKFPFNSGVWGTASDWVIILVTSLTAVYLYNSFKAQKESNGIQNKTLEEQQKLTEIEQIIFREKIKPVFELKVGGGDNFMIDPQNEIANVSYSFNFFVHNSEAHAIKTIGMLDMPNGKENKQILHTERNALYPGQNSSTMRKNYVQEKRNPPLYLDADYIFRFSFKISYLDMLNNPYEQEIIFYHDSNKNINLHQGGPKPVSIMQNN